MNEPIRIAVVKYDDSCNVIEITPEIARQIVALVCMDDLRRMAEETEIVAMAKRIENLERGMAQVEDIREAWRSGLAQQPAQPVAAHAYERDSEDTGDCAECGRGVADSVYVDAFPEVTEGIEAIMRGDPEPATAADGGAGEEATVQALVDGMKKNTGTMHGMAIGALAAIRAGKVPGVATTDERWHGTVLASIEMAYAALGAPIGDPDDRDPAYIGEAVVKQLDAERRLLAAVRQELTAMTVVAQGWRRDTQSMEKERDEAQGLIHFAEESGNAIQQERDKALADLATAAQELGGFQQGPFEGSGVANGIRALSMRCAAVERDLAAANERAARMETMWRNGQEREREMNRAAQFQANADKERERSDAMERAGAEQARRADENLEALRQARAEADAARAEVAKLRGAMLSALEATNARLSGDEDTEFICMGADEIRIHIGKLKAEVAAMKGRKVPRRVVKCCTEAVAPFVYLYDLEAAGVEVVDNG
jgi:hypothetical protein